MRNILPLAFLVSSVGCGDTTNNYYTNSGGKGSADPGPSYMVRDACEGLTNCDDKYKHDYGKDMELCLSTLPKYAATAPEMDEGCWYKCFATQCQDNMEDHCYQECI
ncbi:MAG: hypothetical protein AABX31_00240 [Nanoarchaeota archaeon]